MRITSRQISTTLISFLILATLIVIGLDVARGQINTLTYIDLGMLPIFGALLWASWRGWGYVPYVLVAMMTLLVGSALNEPFLTRQYSNAVLIPAIIAVSLTNTPWIMGSAALTLAILVARAGGHGVYTEPVALIIYAFSVSGLVLGRLVATSAARRAEHARAEAEAANNALHTVNAGLEQRIAERTAEVQVTLAEVEARSAEQARLLEENERQRSMIRDLSVPVLPVGNDMLVMPLVGSLDSERQLLLQTQALQHIEREHARFLLLDVTGVPVIDSQVAQGLIEVARAARLLGAQVALVGVRPEVAQTIVGLGLRLEEIKSFASLRDGLQALRQHS